MSTVHEYRCPNGHGRRQRLLDAYTRDLCCSVCEARLVIDEEPERAVAMEPETAADLVPGRPYTLRDELRDKEAALFGPNSSTARIQKLERERLRLVSENTRLQNDLGACEGREGAWRESAEDAEEAVAELRKELVDCEAAVEDIVVERDAMLADLDKLVMERDEVGLQLDAAKKHLDAMSAAIRKVLAKPFLQGGIAPVLEAGLRGETELPEHKGPLSRIINPGATKTGGALTGRERKGRDISDPGCTYRGALGECHALGCPAHGGAQDVEHLRVTPTEYRIWMSDEAHKAISAALLDGERHGEPMEPRLIERGSGWVMFVDHHYYVSVRSTVEHDGVGPFEPREFETPALAMEWLGAWAGLWPWHKDPDSIINPGATKNGGDPFP